MPIGTTYANDISVTTVIEAMNCCECGLTFGLSSEFEQRRREDHRNWYCPNGHPQHFPGKTRLEQERDAARELAQREARRRELAERRANNAEQDADNSRRSAAAYKGWATRVRNRIKNGVCPCCNRSFSNVRRHMASQHPDYKVPEVADA